MDVVELSCDYGGRTLTLQTGKIAKQSNSVIVRYGDTVVLVAVVASKDVKEGQDFFPLTVDYAEKYYSAGRIPGGFFKREAKPSDRATLAARCIDRPIRPLFPEDYLCETNVTVTVLSTDGVNEAEIAASIGASAALHMSDLPWAGPIGSCRVGQIDGQFITNITPEQLPNSAVDLLVSGVRTGVIMVEGSSKEVSEQVLIDAIDYAHKEMQPVLDMIEEFRKKTGSKEKRDYAKPPKDEALKAQLKKALWPLFTNAFAIREKLERYAALDEVKKTIKAKFGKDEPETAEEILKNKLIKSYYEELKAVFARELTLDTKKRIDGRSYTDIRNIWCEVGILPRVHGTGLFTRGETQVLSNVTLGTSEDEQKIDSINGVYQKTFLLHYNFPPFSVGEARPNRPPGRREIGHGFLAERALSFIIPSKEVFPYTIRIVAEVLESNGSSSMASVCSGSLALMDAGVPVAKPMAGVAMGLIKEGEKYAVLSDILGDEDHLGDMDFKVCGTADGVTAFQMDLKIGGVSRDIMEQALAQAREGRLHVLSKMNEVLAAPREQLSAFAPRIFTIKIKPDKVREVIGSGGKVIRGIIEQTGVKIDIEDDGSIHIASVDEESAQKAIGIIQNITEEPEIGRIYEGRVTRIAEFGAFVEIIPGTDGLVHISELAHYRVRRTEDILKEGDVVKVKCLDVDSQGKIRLSRKALLPKEGEEAPRPDGGDDEGGGGGGGERPERPERTAPANGEAAVVAESAADDEEAIGNRIDHRGGGDRDRGPRSGGGRDFGGRSGGGDRDRGPRGGGDRDRGPRGGGDRDRGPRGGGDRDRGPRGGGGRDFGGRSGGGDRDRGPRGGGDRDRGPRGGGRDFNDRGPRGGGDRDRGPRGGGDRDRGPRGSGDRDFTPRGGGDRDRGPREPRGGGEDRIGDRENAGNRWQPQPDFGGGGGDERQEYYERTERDSERGIRSNRAASLGGGRYDRGGNTNNDDRPRERSGGDRDRGHRGGGGGRGGSRRDEFGDD